MNDEYLIYGETLTGIADSIRSVANVSTKWTPEQMAAYILANLVKPTARQAAKTYTPGTSDQTIAAGTYLTGAATIAGDANLASANIVKNKSIFGIPGSASGIWGDPDSFYGFTKVASGSFTLGSTLSSETHTITHNLGVLPRLVIYYTDATASAGGDSTKRNAINGIAFATTNEAETNKSGSKYVLGSGQYWQCLIYKNSSSIDSHISYATTSESVATGYSSTNLRTMYYPTVSGSAYGIGTIFNCTTSVFGVRVGYAQYMDGALSSIYNGFGTKTWKWIAMA